MKNRSLSWLLGMTFVAACATAENPEDLCNPRDPNCRFSSALAGDGDGNDPDGGTAIAGSANGEAGATNGGAGAATNGGAGMGNTAGDSGEGGEGGEDNGTGGGDNGGAGAGGAAAGASGEGGTAGVSGDGGAAGAPECTTATQAADCDDGEDCTDDACVSGMCEYTNNTDPCMDDGEVCTDDVCAGGTCTHPNNTDDCTDDGDPCTDDVCGGGTCTHPAIGGCSVNTIKIQTNRSSGGQRYVVVDAANGNILTWNATTEGAGEVFETIPVTGTQFKLRASNNNFVELGANDDLYATEPMEANAAVIDMAPCATSNAIASNCTPDCVGLQVVGDDDADNFVSSDGANPPGTMRAFRANCGTSNGTWESFVIIDQ